MDTREVTNPSSIAAALMLARREWVRFFRQRNRVIGAVAQPLLFWLLFGAGLRGSFSWDGGQGFLEYFLPGTIALVVLFTAIFATISVIEDRREGFLQGVLVAPISRSAVLIGKVLGGGAIAWVQAVAFLLLALCVGTVPLNASILLAIVMLGVMAATLVGVGMVIAWPMESTQGFHAIMNLVLMPMWLLSGAFFPIPSAVGGDFGRVALQWIMRANPLSYAMVELRRLMYPQVDFAAAGWAPSHALCWSVALGFMIVTLWVASRLMQRRTQADVLV